MTRQMLGFALFWVAPLCLISCERPPLGPTGVDPIPAGATSPVATTSPGVAPELNGTWSGELQVQDPRFNWGPFDRLTVRFNPDSSLGGMQFASNFPPPHLFGSESADFPLQGTRDAPIVRGSLYTVRVTVDTAEFGKDHFHMRYRVVNIGATPDTDYVEDLSGQLAGGILDVRYSADGTLLTGPIAASASGELRLD